MAGYIEKGLGTVLSIYDAPEIVYGFAGAGKVQLCSHQSSYHTP